MYDLSKFISPTINWFDKEDTCPTHVMITSILCCFECSPKLQLMNSLFRLFVKDCKKTYDADIRYFMSLSLIRVIRKKRNSSIIIVILSNIHTRL